jgi:hypothetical protein
MTWLAGRSATDGTGGGDAAELSCFISGVSINQTILLIASKNLIRLFQRQNFHHKTEASFHP